jgi:predicted nucleic acid-binding protein
VNAFYLDASAVVKLVRGEPESSALWSFIEDSDLVSSELILAEVPRAARRIASDDSMALEPMLDNAEQVLRRIAMRPLDSALLVAAGGLTGSTLGALDAIHIATAADIYPISAFVTYDDRQGAAARLLGLPTVAPGAA